MTDPQGEDLIDVAGAIADGRPIDWRVLESAAPTPEARERLRRLQLLAGIGRLHSDLTSIQPPTFLHESLLHPAHALGDAVEPSAPVTWGPLTVIEKVGKGTFGDVYRARESRLDREVALKLLRHRDGRASDASDVIEEARLMASVRHPNVTTIYGADRIDGRVGLWMEFIDGPTLEDEFGTQGRFAVAELRRVGVEVAAALAAVHCAGLLHRDVKAHNVMRAGDGRLLLTDFGTGLPLDDRSPATGEPLIGTPLYVAPEVLDGAPATVQSDLYSLGVLLFHLATGSFPVSGASLEDLRLAHTSRDRSRLRRERPDLPPSLADAVDRALSPRPADRPATADAFARQLGTDRRSHRRVAIAVVAMMIAVLAGATAWMAWRPTTQSAVAGPGVDAPVLTGADASGVLAVSRDGRYVAYSAGGELGVRDLTTGTIRVLTSSASWTPREWIDSAVFSPDGQRLASTWLKLERGFVRVSIRLLDREHPSEVAPIFTDDLDNFLWVCDWSADGKFLALNMARRGVVDLAILPADGGQPVAVHTLDWRGSSSLKFSPDSRYLAYDYPTDTSTAQRDVGVVDLERRDVHPIMTGLGHDWLAGWSPDGTRLLVTSNRRASMSLWSRALVNGRATGEPRLERSDVRDDVVGLTDDGRLFYRTISHDQIVVVIPVDLVTGKQTAPAFTPIASSLYRFGKPKWSPDGRWLAHMSAVAYGNGGQDHVVLSVQSLADGGARTLPLKLQSFWTYSWSPDQRTILARALDFQRRQGIFSIDANTGDVALVFVSTDEGWFVQPQWRPEGRGFTYVKGSPAGSPEDVVMERDMASGGDRVVVRHRDLRTASGAAVPVLRDYAVSPDGTHIAGVDGADAYHAVWVASIATGVARQVFRVERGPKPDSCCGVPITHNAIIWADNKALIINAGISAEPRQRRELWIVPAAEGEAPRRVDVGATVVRNDAPAIRPDGKQIAFLSGEGAVYEIRALRYALPR